MAIDIFSEYLPIPWQVKMHGSHWRHGCFAGGKGGGKTRAGLEELYACAMEFPGSTYLIGRKTSPSLRDTTWKELLEILPEDMIVDVNKTSMTINLVNGSQFLGRPLDEVKKFDSLKISGFLIDEADEIAKEIYDTLKSRVRQMVKGKVPRYRTILILNPCEEDHWIPQLFVHNRPHDHELFFSSTMDNQANLPPGYVEELESIYSPDMQQRMIHGMFGKVHKGRPVFPQFARGNYIRFDLPVIAEAPIFMGFDFGFRRPAVTFVQWIDGQLRVLGEILGKDIYLDDFLKEKVFPYQAQHFPNHAQFKSFCDPRGSDESDKGSTSVEILNDHQIFPIYRRSRIDEGIKAIKEVMDGQTNGDPNFVIHARCKILIEAFKGGYHRLDGEDSPEKDGYFDNIMDSFRYAALHLVKRHRFNNANKVFQSQNVHVNRFTGRRREF